MASKINDITLVKLAKKNDQQAHDELYNRYKKYFDILTANNFTRTKGSGVTYEDVYSVAVGTLQIAISKFDTSKGTSFLQYWKTIANHEINELFKNESYQGRAKTFDGISLDDYSQNGYYKNEEIYGCNDSSTALDLEDVRILIEKEEIELTPREKQILIMTMDGLDLEEISSKLALKYVTAYHHYTYGVQKINNYLKKIKAL